MKKIISSLIIFISGALSAQTHQPLLMYGFEQIPGSMELNPALTMQNDYMIGIPVFANINLSAHANSYAWEDILKREGDRTFIDYQNISDVTRDKNFINTQFSTNILQGGIANYSGGYWSFGLNTNVDVHLNLPGDALDLILFGNNDSRNVNKWMSLENLDAEISAYTTWHLGYSFDLNKRVRLGGRLKMYNGLANASIRENDFEVITKKESLIPSEIEVKGSAQVFWTGIDAFSDDPEDPAMSPINFNNLGLGIDLGIDYMFNKKMYLSASIVDLGFIQWNDEGQGYDVHLDSTIKWSAFAFDVSGDPDLLEDEIEDWFDEMEDNLKTDSLTNTKYTTMMAMKTYINGTYRINKNNFLSATFAGQLRGDHYTAGLGVNYHIRVGKSINLRTGVSYMDNQADFGIGTNFRIGKFNMFLISDNLMSMISPRTSKGVNFAMGMNLQINKKGGKKRNAYGRTRWDNSSDN